MSKSLFFNCLHCGYNLSGLTEERCPECGQSFAPAEIQAICWQFKPSPGRALGKILLVPLLFTLLGAVTGLVMERVHEDVGVLALWGAVIAFLVYGIVQSIRLAKSFAWQRAIRTEGRRPIGQASPFIIAVTAGLICCQTLLSAAGFFGGCVCGYLSIE